MKKFIILIPIFNDWKSVFKLLENIDLQITKWDAEVSVLIVNDASTESRASTKLSYTNLKSVRIMNMKKNQGHARCNDTGLKFLTEKEDFDYVIPMDGDGEDRPEEIKEFVDNLNYNSDKPTVGKRVKRSDGIFFKFCYFFQTWFLQEYLGYYLNCCYFLLLFLIHLYLLQKLVIVLLNLLRVLIQFYLPQK